MPAEGKHAPWRLWILIVLWVLQLLLLGYSLIIYIVVIVAMNNYSRAIYSGTNIAWIASSLSIVVISLGLTITECVQVGRRSLTPKFYLISNGSKAVSWTAITVASLVVERDSINDSGASAGLTIVITIIMLLFFILPLIYGIIIVVKQRKRRGMPYKSVADPLIINSNTAYSARAGAPGNVELESGLPHPGVYAPPKDARFESYRQSAVVADPYGAAPSYGQGLPYDGAHAQHSQPQYGQPQQQHVGYAS